MGQEHIVKKKCAPHDSEGKRKKKRKVQQFHILSNGIVPMTLTSYNGLFLLKSIPPYNHYCTGLSSESNYSNFRSSAGPADALPFQQGLQIQMQEWRAMQVLRLSIQPQLPTNCIQFCPNHTQPGCGELLQKGQRIDGEGLGEQSSLVWPQ